MNKVRAIALNQRGTAPILILVGVLILAVVAGGAYFLGKSSGPKPSTPVVSQTPQPTPSPTPDASPAPTGTGETANWKTYTNTKKGFSVSYPGEWNAVDEPNTIFSKKDSNLSCVIFIDNFKAVIGSTGEPYFGNAPYKNLEKSGTKLGNLSATKYILHEGEGGSYILIVNNQPLNNLAYRLQCSSGTNNLGDVDSVIDKMASTFKFTQ